MQLTKKRVSIISVCLVLVLLFSLIINSLGYFSDTIFANSNGTVGTVDVSLDDSGINLLNQFGQDILNPGDMRPVKFTITNDGNKSVDTEVVITLTTMRGMSNNDCDTSVQDKEVYSSEYELYYEKDVEYIEGYGYYPKAGAKPIDVRYKISDNQIKYILDGNVLSGNLDLDEQEIEYELKADYVPEASDLYVLENQQDFRIYNDAYIESIIDGETNCDYAVVWFYNDFTPTKVAIPNSGKLESDYLLSDRIEPDVEYIVFEKDSAYGIDIPASITDMYIDANVKAFVVYNYDDNTSTVYTKEEFENVYDVTIHHYNDLDEVVNGIPSHITITEYEALSDSEKANYVKCDDSKAFDMVLLFDPHSGNKFQNSSVSIQIEAKAKQHRNTEMGWELVTEITEASIDTSIFTVERNVFGQVELTGVQTGVDISTMENIVIPEGVEVIPALFFYHEGNIKTVTLPSTIKVIGQSAFEDCYSLTTINLPEGLETIDTRAFQYCDVLIEVTIPDSVTFIGDNAFNGGTNIVYTNNELAIKYFSGYNGFTVLPLED